MTTTIRLRRLPSFLGGHSPPLWAPLGIHPNNERDFEFEPRNEIQFLFGGAPAFSPSLCVAALHVGMCVCVCVCGNANRVYPLELLMGILYFI